MFIRGYWKAIKVLIAMHTHLNIRQVNSNVDIVYNNVIYYIY